LIFAHLARAAARILASPAAEMCRFGLVLLREFVLPLCFAHLAFCAAAIRLRAAADMVRPAWVLEVFPVTEVRALIAAFRRSRCCCSSLTIASRFAMAGDCSIWKFSVRNLLTAISHSPPWLPSGWGGRGRRLSRRRRSPGTQSSLWRCPRPSRKIGVLNAI